MQMLSPYVYKGNKYIMPCILTFWKKIWLIATGDYLNHCQIIIGEVLWPEHDFKENTHEIYHWCEFVMD